jgi:hypothetical protein
VAFFFLLSNGGSGIGSSGFLFGRGLDVALDWIVMITNVKGCLGDLRFILARVLVVVCIECYFQMYVSRTIII